MRKLILLLLLFSFPALAQLLPQTQPTQPTVITVHEKPAPSSDGCSTAFTACVNSSLTNAPAAQILIEYCGSNYESFTHGDNTGQPCGIPDEGALPDFPINCITCTCPAGQIRADGLCVPDQYCNWGIQDFVTGACYAPTCPYGDGTAENCGLAPSCVASENAILIPASAGSSASCQCPIFTTWDSDYQSCQAPVCGLTVGTPLNSIFDAATGNCQCSITATLDVATNACVENTCNGANEIFSPTLHACVVGNACPFGYDLNTSTNACYKIINDQHDCGGMDKGEFHQQVAYVSWDGITPDATERLNEAIAACEALKAEQQYYLEKTYFMRTYNQYVLDVWPQYAATQRWIDPSDFCVTRHGIWNANLNTCMNGQVQPPPNTPPSSSSSSSNSSSSLSSYSSSSLSSASGGASGSSGAGTSSGSGSGGEGGEGEGGSGSGNGSAASAMSAQNSSVNVSVDSNSSAQNSVNNSVATSSPNNNGTASSAGSGSNNSASGSSGTGTSSGTNTSSGSGGTGGGGGTNTSVGNNTSQASNSSARSGECDPESSNYLDCIGKDKKPFADHAVTDSGLTSVDQINSGFLNRVSNSPLVNSFHQMTNVIVINDDATCPPLSIDLSDTVIATVLSTTVHCDLMESLKPILSIISMMCWTFLAFRIFASA